MVFGAIRALIVIHVLRLRAGNAFLMGGVWVLASRARVAEELSGITAVEAVRARGAL